MGVRDMGRLAAHPGRWGAATSLAVWSVILLGSGVAAAPTYVASTRGIAYQSPFFTISGAGLGGVTNIQIYQGGSYGSNLAEGTVWRVHRRHDVFIVIKLLDGKKWGNNNNQALMARLTSSAGVSTIQVSPSPPASLLPLVSPSRRPNLTQLACSQLLRWPP